MNFFKNRYDKAGPGIEKDAPRKKGFSLFVELLSRNFFELVKLNFLFFVAVLPAQLFFGLFLWFMFSLNLVYMLVFGILALLAAVIVGPAYGALCYIVIKMIREEPRFLWHDFKKSFNSCFKQTLVPGIVFCLIIASQIFNLLFYKASGQQIDFINFGLLVLSVFLLAFIFPYFFAQAPYLELKVIPLLKNSILLSFAFAPFSLGSAILGGGLMIAQLFTFPASLLATVVLGYSLPCLISMLFIWPKIDNQFKISEALLKKQEEAYEASEKTNIDNK